MSNLHHFDENGYYTGTSEVPINPVTGNPFQINESVATLEPIPTYSLETERVRRIDGIWVVEAIPNPEPDPEKEPEHVLTDDELRNTAMESINFWRMREEQKDIVFDFDGHQWDGGLMTRQRLQPVLSLTELPEGFFWTDHLNNDVLVTKEKLHQLNAAHEASLVAEGFRIHVKQRQLKAMVAGMSREELENFNIKNYT